MIGVLSLVVLVFATSAVIKVLSGETSIPSEKAPSYIRVQILNGCGIPGAASKTGSIIRNIGIPDADFDVIDEDNFETFDVSETMILIRDEQVMEDAHSLAERLGIVSENVVPQQLDDNYLSLDLTIILGKDFEAIARRVDVAGS